MSDDNPTERFPASEPASTEPLSPTQGATEPINAQPLNAQPLNSQPLNSQPAAGPEPIPAPAPTEVLWTPSNAAPTAPGRPTTYGAPPEPKSRAMLYTLIGVGAALLIAIIIVVVMLLNRGGDEPVVAPSGSASPSASASPSPSATPSESPSAEPEPEPEPETPVVVGPTFDSFDAQPSAGCAEGDTSKPLSFSWSSSNAKTAYIGVATTNAKAEPYEGNLPVVYTFDTLEYQCNQATQVYTVTLEDAAGNLAHQTVTIAK